MTQPARTPLTPNAPTTGWTVNQQQQTIESYQGQTPTRGWRVYFTLAAGPTGSVFLPDSMYTPVNVRAAIAAQAAQLTEIQGMTG